MYFGFNEQNNAASNSPQILNLQKNQVLDLTKHAPALKRAILAGGWDVATSGASADLDIAAFLLDSNGRIHSANDVIFFNHMASTGIVLEDDNRIGSGDGDDERIDIDLDQIPAEYSQIVFAIVIFDAQTKRQSFGMVRNAFVRLLDADDDEREICRYNLTEDYGTDTAVIACSLNRVGNGWEMQTVGEGMIGDLNTIASRYM